MKRMTTHFSHLALLASLSLLGACSSSPPPPATTDMSVPHDLARDLTRGPDLEVACTTVCSGVCVDTRYDPNNCGACGKQCAAVPNGTPGCLNGTCGLASCNSGYSHCTANAADGCETHTDSDPSNCGACNKICSVTNATAACSAGACTIASCSAGFDDCNKMAGDGCETGLATDAMNCGKCGMACSAGQVCQKGSCVNPLSFNVLEKKDITYAGINYYLLKVSLKSNTATSDTWCLEYEKLCEQYGAEPTGCGDNYTNMNNGYGMCRTMYKSDGVSNTLGCNPSSGIAAAAQANGYADASGTNSFGFHYCDAGTCQKTLCNGDYCNTSLSYFDASKDHGYTLCKKP